MTSPAASASPSAAAPARRTFLPFSRPTIEEDEIAEVVDSLKSGWITTGPKVARFEQMFKDRFAPCEAISVCSATAGLHIAIAALDLKPTDEVIVPSLTWASTANVVELCGARTVFADVDPDTLCIDPKDVERRITPNTKAIVPVHYAGEAADLDALRALAKKHGLRILEDAAHSLGTYYKGQEIGATGELVVYSFHPIKNITTGEGGMIVCRDEALAERMRLLRFHGVSKNAWSRYKQGTNPQYDVLLPGLKYNMLDLQAALGIRQLAKLDRFNARRLELAQNYARLLQRVPELKPLGRAKYDSVHCWHLYVVRLDLKAVTIGRNEFMQEMQAENVGVGLHFTALHMSSWYAKKYGYRAGSLPHAELAGDSIFSLPLYPLLTEADQEDVVAALARVVGRHRRTQA